ncbi:Hint domain-containing protein [Adhaeribacter aquaticus]|uniref:Hint domain-containing protein n=1 Tax=Adhaeribacter aquaticus TaxID=299567 RepID=UPI00146FBCE9|nr:Hint domain-containing protein [Adhaeribacter aquaticus]
MRKSILSLMFVGSLCISEAKPVDDSRALTLSEYQKAKSFSIKDLDNETYVKFENAYILDRYESRKPYFITGDDGLKKRIDLYRLLAKDGMQELGTMIFYTNEKGKQYRALLPGFKTEGKIWEQYFEDIHAIDKEEKNFVLKLSYVLSKELSFQEYKALNQGKDMKVESATYGNDICFPGDQLVAMANGQKKFLHQVKAGDQVLTIDPETKKTTKVEVKGLIAHEAKNYAITRLVVVSATEKAGQEGKEIKLTSKILEATPNHPMLTQQGNRKIGEIAAGEEVLCLDNKTGNYTVHTVLQKMEYAGGVQKVYNIDASGGTTFMMNDVMVMQK